MEEVGESSAFPGTKGVTMSTELSDLTPLRGKGLHKAVMSSDLMPNA